MDRYKTLAWNLLYRHFMRRRFKSKYFYTEEELKAIKEEWLKDRKRIDDESVDVNK